MVHILSYYHFVLFKYGHSMFGIFCLKKLNSNHSLDSLDERMRIENKVLNFIYAPINRFVLMLNIKNYF